MSLLFDHLSALFDEGHGLELPDLRDDSHLGPKGTPRPAAVLIAVTERSEPGVLLIHRPHDMRSHPGQVAFPGGKIDPGENAVEAALREAHEELGIVSSDVKVIGATDRFGTGSGFDVTPVLATIPADLPLIPNPAEVSAWFEAPLQFILDPANHAPQSTFWQGEMREYLEIGWQGNRIWGVTAAIIANLSRRISYRALHHG
ncbi:CoA pyrophosphatase [Altererythrobacter confluentis]|uniref:CoA pyrophosphatase n=1 Tax=Allopontixanthobacter confluentis TaxID=1849021 RepID=A0A6L7GEC8_9SPHN|nr:CoA pyrophosphatase [Allopontixanthobacter confluentis]MXP13554.1 CoA pyrophosphatase [Allopontixanthobacter confluentis]